MGRLVSYFVRGLILSIPIVVTANVCWWIFTMIDGWLGFSTPGVGFVITIVLITLVGVLGSTIITKSLFAYFEDTMAKLPLVRLLYSATKDLLNAFVGEKRRFDQPVSLTFTPGGKVQIFGFVTQESLSHLGLDGMVSVYCPHSYAWAGQMIVVPGDQVIPLHHASSDVMAFIVSGGVTGFPQAVSTPASTTEVLQ